MIGFTTLSIDVLEFDKENPRLPSNLKGGSESDILRYLATRTRIENLISSIGENGFFKGEAIVVTPHGPNRYTVIEGNRRLAALRLLQDPSKAKSPGIVRAAKEADNKPTEIPAFVVKSRDDTLQYLGFRHISGVQRWDPLAKARYLEALFEKTMGDTQRRYISVAREIGSTNTTVRRNLDALAAYRLIEKQDFYDIRDVDEESFQFGTFYTAVSNADVGNFIGTRDNGTPTHPIESPDVIIQGHLGELVKWMFERDARGNTRLGESRNIVKLGKVLANHASLLALREGQSLETAYRLTSHGRGEFIRRMNQAIEELKLANANLHLVEEDLETAQSKVVEALKIIHIASNTLGVKPDA